MDKRPIEEADTPWTSVVDPRTSRRSLWRRLQALSEKELRQMVESAVREAASVLEEHAGIFDATVSGETMRRRVGRGSKP